MVTLGCSKNIVDSEHLAGLLGKSSFKVSFDSSDTDFDVVIVNTCGFIGDAKEESVDTVLQFAYLRKSNRIKKLIVFGCLVQRYADELAKELPEVDKFFGANDYEKIAEYLSEELPPQNKTLRQLSTPSHYAYLKISEGCDRFCSFCAIPYIRGRHVSEPIESLVEQAKALASQSVKELIVVAQDTTNYGKDIYGECRLVELLKALAKVEGIEWIRLQYSYPNDFPFELIDLMKNEPKICRYIDMPLQHINDRLLHSMNRHITGKEIRTLINRLREAMPDICLRTTLIVGYPGETQEEFDELKKFVKETKFDRLGAFAYSAEEGTTAYNLPDDVHEEEKQSRLDALIDIQQQISYDLNQKKIGKTYKVLIDRSEGEYWIGRTEYDSPEVDNEVLIPIEQKAEAGSFVMAKINAAEEFDLYADIVEYCNPEKQSAKEGNTQQLTEDILEVLESFVENDYKNLTKEYPDYTITVYTTKDHGENIAEWDYTLKNPDKFPIDADTVMENVYSQISYSKD